MLLAVDIGNTETTIGVFDGEDLVKEWRIATQRDRTSDELALVINSFLRLDHVTGITGVAASSVVPRATQAMREFVPRYFDLDPVIVEPGVRTGMPIRVDNPKEVGADRICNAVATYELYGGPAIAVDLGTATTFDAVSAEGEHLGCAIAPGLAISANALVSQTAMLKRVEFATPSRLIGKSTAESIQSGVVNGYACLIEGMIERIRKELGGDTKSVLTGGLASVMAPNLTGIDIVDPWLVLQGLRIIYERNTD
ncbi:MAG TPA: type III pantothenate kinase [Actinomycetota bacterium]|jgi:type III pantothenate kinase|nr:type III pantothenate kinase [Actinomycetota bacterium]